MKIRIKENWSVSDLPTLAFLILPKGFELLPNLLEIFELELAFYEYKLLTKEEIIRRGAFFKSVDGVYTHHYLLCSGNNPLRWQGSRRAKLYFKEGNFSVGYASHGFFPYKGKFHPQLIKGILNVLRVQPGEVVLDPMCGSGTLNIEASLIGLDSIGFEKNPFCLLMSDIKYAVLKMDKYILSSVMKNMYKDYQILVNSNKFPDSFLNAENSIEKKITLLAFLDAMGYAKRCSKSLNVLFPIVFERYIKQISSFIKIRDELCIEIGKAEFRLGDARDLKIENESIDAIITSPPYSFAIDYIENDKVQLEYLGIDISKLKNEMIGLRGKPKKKNYLIILMI